jgi:hypothetical protein
MASVTRRMSVIQVIMTNKDTSEMFEYGIICHSTHTQTNV